MQITIDCAQIFDRGTFHRAFATKLHFPIYYGENLDALFDCLTSLPENTTLVLQNAETLLDSLGGYGRAALNALTRAEMESEGRLTIRMT